VEIYTAELERKPAEAGHAALPAFYTHPEVTGKNPTVAYTDQLVRNPVNPHALTHKVRLGVMSSGDVHMDYPLMGMIGRPSVVHFAGVTQWTYTGKHRPDASSGRRAGDAPLRPGQPVDRRSIRRQPLGPAGVQVLRVPGEEGLIGSPPNLHIHSTLHST